MDDLGGTPISGNYPVLRQTKMEGNSHQSKQWAAAKNQAPQDSNLSAATCNRIAMKCHKDKYSKWVISYLLIHHYIMYIATSSKGKKQAIRTDINHY